MVLGLALQAAGLAWVASMVASGVSYLELDKGGLSELEEAPLSPPNAGKPALP